MKILLIIPCNDQCYYANECIKNPVVLGNYVYQIISNYFDMKSKNFSENSRNIYANSKRNLIRQIKSVFKDDIIIITFQQYLEKYK